MLTPKTEVGSREIPRSDKWPAVERAHLEKHPQCVACAKSGAVVAVHHVMPFHICIALGRPDLELDERNPITLCVGGEGEHHLLLGHLDDWDSMNLSVQYDAREVFHGKTAKEIRASDVWRAMEAKRAVAFEKMSAAEREVLRVWMKGCESGELYAVASMSCKSNHHARIDGSIL